jgi:predicted XRE-type DNA-binding protein
MDEKIFDIVWEMPEDIPDDIENIRLRSRLMTELTDLIAAEDWTRATAAGRLGVPEPRITDLLGGRTQLFSLDALVNMIAAAGMQVEVTVSPAV